MVTYYKDYKRHFRETQMQINPHCYYCGVLLIYYKVAEVPKGQSLPNNFATIEHLIDRYDQKNRQKIKKGRGKNLVLACYKCNHDRGERRTKEMDQDLLKIRNKILDQRKALGIKTPRHIILKQAGFTE